MTPNAASASSGSAGPSRRSFLASTAVATAAVAGGMPLLAACGGSDSTSGGGSSGGKGAAKLLPAYLGGLKTSVPNKLGKGGKLTVMSPFWGSPPKQDNAYYQAMNALIGVDVVWQNQDGNTYDQKLGAVLASSDVPDMVVVPSWNMGG